MKANNLKIVKPLSLALTFVFFLVLSSCDEYFQPKPRGYFRIHLPEKSYNPIQQKLPYSFDIPVYATLEKDSHPMAEKYWNNILFPEFKAKIHMSYKPIENNLSTLLEDAHKLVNKHIPKANAINERVYIDKEKSVYGVTYSIKGAEAASPFQFYLTDSTTHFLRGALYFNVRPNNDSLSPVISFLEEDIQKLIESFEWIEGDF
jgi:gliding motility-associated lipoprotein GldD